MHVYLNGNFVTTAEAAIPIDDRAFRYGDGMFETITCYNGMLYQPEFHFNRLFEGLESIRINGIDRDVISNVITSLIMKNNIDNGIVRIAISRGRGGRGYLPEETSTPTILIETLPHPPAPTSPATLWLSNYQKISAHALPIRSKLTAQGLSSTLARIEAQENDCDEALLLNAEGHICEAASANLFWLKKEVLYTPSLDCGVLRGSVREKIIALSPFPIREGHYKLKELLDAEALVLTNIVIGVRAVSMLQPSGYTFETVTLAQQLQALLDEDIKRSCEL